MGDATLVVMGYVRDAFGLHGWLKIHADTEYATTLFDYPVWWLGKEGQWTPWRYEQGAPHSNSLIVKLEGVSDRNNAEALRGYQVAIPRSQLPEPEEDEYYWSDLIGLEVINLDGESLGQVSHLLETGANDVLVVRGGTSERLIPFISQYIGDIDLKTRRLFVDWSADF